MFVRWLIIVSIVLVCLGCADSEELEKLEIPAADDATGDVAA